MENCVIINEASGISKPGCLAKPAAISSLLVLMLSGPLLSAENVACAYMALTESHEAVMRCESISSEREQQYRFVRMLLKDFINKNARTDKDKISSDYDERIRRHYALRGDEICGNSVYPFLRELFMMHTAPESIDFWRKDLEQPRDPTEGECL